MTWLWIVGVLAVVLGLTVLYERRHWRIWNAALASVTWHEDKEEWSVVYNGTRWYVETERHAGRHEPTELGKARAFPFGHQAGLDFTLKLHGIIEIANDVDVKKAWRTQHGVALEQDKSP